MQKMIRNIDQAAVVSLGSLVECKPGQIVSTTLAQNRHHNLTLFAFDQGEEISSHSSSGDALVMALEGVGRITIDGRDHLLHAGESIVMPAGIPHAVAAEEGFKMLLFVLFPDQPENGR